ncbi:MAG: Succinylornithine transaminase/acetylornithine aminotransferase [Lentisphaerae bacterium ADurb.BinA184]|nr:MAG: Succinylornithine transaminase/acetylornithine aminotransferase [Lentisphaerae bacterium ADurb.BinA184]
MKRNAVNRQEILDLHDAYVMHTYFPADLVLVRGAMSRVWDANGVAYLDFSSGISVCNLGHCHPRVTEAIQRQAATLVHVSNLFLHPNQPRLAAQLAAMTMGGRVFFCNSGAEANEGLIKFARRWGHERGRYEIIAMQDSFHGRTLATLAATGRDKYRKGFQPDLAGFTHVPFNSLEAAAAAVNERTAAILLEPIQGEGGVIPADPAYLAGIRRLCDERGILLLFDEVQCGMGRTGSLFAYQHYGVEPDGFSMAKALGNGFPIGAIQVRQAHKDALPAGTHASTFGGNPLACAAALAVLETFGREDVLGNCRRMAARLWQRLHALKAAHPAITEIRGVGLMIGIVVNRPVKELKAAAQARRLLILTAGENVLRLLPPLTIDEAGIDEAADILADVFAHA